MNRVGEVGYNNFGSKMVIVKYRKNSDIDIYFPEYDWTFKNTYYSVFKNGKIRCPYERTVYDIGYLGEGKYKVKENGKTSRVYNTWRGILTRCYSDKYQEKHFTYEDCNASEKFHNFQNFGDWDSENFYQIEGEKMCLDKDILVKHNKIYSPETCIYVPQRINTLFTKSDKSRGDYPIGISYEKTNSKFKVQCHLINPETGKSKLKHLGYYETQEKAFEVYKYYKEKNIKQVADYYKNKIPTKLYDAMYKYEVEITD